MYLARRVRNMGSMESVGMKKSWNKPYDRDDPAAQTTDASSEGGRIVSVSLTARSEYWAWDISQSGAEDSHKMKEEPHSSSGLLSMLSHKDQRDPTSTCKAASTSTNLCCWLASLRRPRQGEGPSGIRGWHWLRAALVRLSSLLLVSQGNFCREGW